jgi:hypothetical protein
MYSIVFSIPSILRSMLEHNSYIHTYHSRFISVGVAEASQIFVRDTFYQNYLAMRNAADMTGGKLIAV